MSIQSLRDYLQVLEKEGELLRIRESLSPIYEIPSVFKQLGLQNGPAALIENVEGYDVPVAGNLFSSVKKLSLALETKEDNLLSEYTKRCASPLPPKLIEKEQAPVKEVIIKEGIDLMKTLPVLKSHAKDAAPYITQGIMFLKDSETGTRDMALRRLQVKGPNKLGVYFFGFTARKAWQKKEAEGRPLEVAIAVGLDPALVIAGNIWSPFGDRLSLAGGLRRQGVEMVKGETVDVDVPATSMFVIEGKILPDYLEPEGPFGEMMGYYHTTINPVLEVTAITHQKNPVYSSYVTFSRDDAMIFEYLGKPQLSSSLKALIPSLKDVFFSLVDNLIIVSITKKNKWESRQALYSIMSAIPFVKIVVVVDDDIDVNSMDDVKWALCGRFQPEEDAIITSGLVGSGIEPSLKEGLITSKLGIDATKPIDKPEKFEKVSVPKDIEKKTLKILEKYLVH